MRQLYDSQLRILRQAPVHPPGVSIDPRVDLRPMTRLTTLRPRIGAAKLSRIPSLTTEASPRKRGSAGVKDRNRIRERDCGMCQECKRQGRTTRGFPVDHIVPLWKGGSDQDWNKETLCDECHKEKSSREAKERAALG